MVCKFNKRGIMELDKIWSFNQLLVACAYDAERIAVSDLEALYVINVHSNVIEHKYKFPSELENARGMLLVAREWILCEVLFRKNYLYHVPTGRVFNIPIDYYVGWEYFRAVEPGVVAYIEDDTIISQVTLLTKRLYLSWFAENSIEPNMFTDVRFCYAE